MMKSFPKLLRAFLFALIAAGGFATVVIVAQDVCGNPLACFEPGQEGEIWQALTPFGQINDSPACTNSEPTAARIREDSRQCTRDDEQQPIPAPYPVLMPPSLGQFLDPFALAVDGERIYISDQSNHRIQVMKFDGTPIKIAHPIGDGVAGDGPYPAYPADSRMTGNDLPITGQRLYSPDGLAVDATGKLVVGDYSGYINVFNPDGSPAFGTMAAPERFQIIDTIDGLGNLGTKASGIAMTPGTVVRGFQVAVPVDDTSRIVVTDRLNCFIYIYDSGFNLKRQIPEVISPDAYQGACVYDEEAAPLGVFSAPVAAAIDTQGHIYISDYDNNRIQILDLAGDPLGEFGRESLQYPWGVVVDHKGRVAVADTENQRLAFFTVDYSGALPVASYVFELDAKGTLNGYPTAIAEQVGTGAGLDPAGRFLVTDTLNNRIQRFQLPDLAIINKSIDPGGFGSFQVVVPDGKAAPVTFVGVSAVGIGATVLSINGVDPGNTAVLNPANTALQNATVALGTTIAPGQIVTYNFTFAPAPGRSDYTFALNAVGNGGETLADRQDVDASAPCLDCLSTHQIFAAPGVPTVPATLSGGWYNTQLTVRINATTTHPDGLSGIGYQFLSGPESSGLRWGGTIHIAPVSGNAAFFDFGVQSQGVSKLRYWAIGADGTVESSHPLTLSLDLSMPNVVFNIPAANGAGWNNTAVSASYTVNDGPSGPAAPTTGSLSFPSEGRLQFQSVTASDIAGNVSVGVESHLSSRGGHYINIDTRAPNLTPPANLTITIPATGPGYALAPASFVATAVDPPLVDARPGADLTGSGVVVLLNPGVTPFPVGQTTPFIFTATDAAGNTSTANASVTVVRALTTISAGNQIVEYGQPMVVTATLGASFATGPVTFTFGPSGEYSVAGNASGGFATASIPPVLLNSGTYPMQVSFAGDPSVLPMTTTATVTVQPKAVTITAVAQTKVYGSTDPALVLAPLPPGTLVGTDTITGSLTRVSGENVGSYAIQRGTIALSANYSVTYVGANLTITPRPIQVTAVAASKPAGTADPVFAFTITQGSLVAGDNFGGALTRALGESAGLYHILQGTLTLGPNYTIGFVPADFAISVNAVTVRAIALNKTYGTSDPAWTSVPGLTFTSEGTLYDGVTFSGRLERDAGEAIGTYRVNQGTLSLPPGYALLYHSASFVIAPRGVIVTAGSGTKTFGSPDPTLVATDNGFLASDNIVLSLTRAAGQNVGNYATTPNAAGAALTNYQVAYVPGNLSITPAYVTVTARAKAITYGDAEPTFDFDYGAFPAGYSAASVAGAPSCGVAGAHGNAGDYTVTCSGGTIDGNVLFSYAPASFSVARKNVTLIVNDKSRTFGAANPALTAVAGGLVAGDTLDYTLATSATTLTPVGGHPITAALGSNPNYNVAVTNGTLTIGRATATVTANPKSKTYGEANPALDAVVAGAVPGAPISYALATSATQLSGVGSHPITVILGANPNYDVTFVPATLTIAPKAATVTAGNAQKIAGTLDPALPVSGAGFLPGDAVVLSATRGVGEAVATYIITPRVTGASVGNYTITYVNGVFTIISDNRPPVCGTAYGGEIWPPNHKKFYAAPIGGVADPDGGPVTILVTGIWQDELIDSTGDGKFSPDGNGIGTSTAWVRAERNGHGNKAAGNGRVYEILFTATDNRGASCTGSVFYTVPHDQGQGSSAIDSGMRYDSTGVVPGARDKSQIHQNSPRP